MPTTPPIKIPITGQDKFSKKFKGVVANVRKAGRMMKTAGASMTRYATMPILLAAGASTKFGLDLNKSMANVATLIPGNLKRVKQLKQGVQDLSVETGKSTEEISSGLYQTISAFQDNIDTQERLRLATRASVAGVAETRDAITMLSIVTKGYGDASAEAVQKASDLAFQTVRLGVTTFPELAESMGKTVAFAKSLKVSQEELFTGFATLTGVTGNTAEVATQLRGVMGAMLKPSSALAKTVKKLGYSSAMAMMQEEGFVGTLLKLKEAVKGNDSKLAQMLGRKEAITAALALTGAQTETYTKKLVEMKNAAGATDAAFREQTEGINKAGHDFEVTKRKMIKAMQRVGDVIIPIITRIMDKVEPWIKKFEEAPPAMIETGLKIALVVAAAGPLLTVLGSATIAVSGLMTALGGAGAVGLGGGLTALAAAGGPIALAVLATVGLVTALDDIGKEAVPKARTVFMKDMPEALAFYRGEIRKTKEEQKGLFEKMDEWLYKQANKVVIPIQKQMIKQKKFRQRWIEKEGGGAKRMEVTGKDWLGFDIERMVNYSEKQYLDALKYEELLEKKRKTKGVGKPKIVSAETLWGAPEGMSIEPPTKLMEDILAAEKYIIPVDIEYNTGQIGRVLGLGGDEISKVLPVTLKTEDKIEVEIKLPKGVTADVKTPTGAKVKKTETGEILGDPI